jgi:chromate transport protein ChrA
MYIWIRFVVPAIVVIVSAYLIYLSCRKRIKNTDKVKQFMKYVFLIFITIMLYSFLIRVIFQKFLLECEARANSMILDIEYYTLILLLGISVCQSLILRYKKKINRMKDKNDKQDIS